MALDRGLGRARLERLPSYTWLVVAVLVLTLLYTVLQIAIVRPHLWPAGSGMLLQGDSASCFPLPARPPEIDAAFSGGLRVIAVAPGSPAADAGLVPGDLVLETGIGDRGSEIGGTGRVTFADREADRSNQLAVWRDLYWTGVSGPLDLTVRRGQDPPRTLTLARPAVRQSAVQGWTRRHASAIAHTVVFSAGALLLFLLRSHDPTSELCVLALALSAVGGGGPLLGAEASLPLGGVLTVFAWVAGPLALPVIALAILHFPARSPVLDRHRWIRALPLVAAAPMIVPALLTSLYLCGADRLLPAAVWDASHPHVSLAAAAGALGLIGLAVAEFLCRYRFNHDANERRRIRIAVCTVAPGVMAYAVRDGMPFVASLIGVGAPTFPTPVWALLGALALLPAFGVVYAVGIAGAAGPQGPLRGRLPSTSEGQASAPREGDAEATRGVTGAVASVAECPRCGRCEESDVTVCPSDGATLQAVRPLPRMVDGKYRIEQLLGRGGMGAVYRAHDLRLDRPVALKVVRAELLADPEARRRFRHEAQTIARLQHPSIVSVFDYGTVVDGGAYVVMEFVRGEDLRRVLQREGRLDAARAMPILSAVCSAIEAAHREGVLHCDLKPENIMLPGGSVEAKVLDFGVTKVIADEPRDPSVGPPADPTVLTPARMIVGTAAYMAPEQFRGGAIDARTDVFALGVIAYEMLSGDLPFGRGSLADVVLAQARGVPPMPPAVASPATERAIRAALDPDPDRRPASPQAFAHLLSATLVIG